MEALASGLLALLIWNTCRPTLEEKVPTTKSSRDRVSMTKAEIENGFRKEVSEIGLLRFLRPFCLFIYI